MIQIKNNKISVDTWCGMEIQPASYYELQILELNKWQNDSKVLVDIAAGDLIVNNGTSDIIDVALAINFLKNIDSAPKDTNGAPIVKMSPFSDAGGFRFRGASFSDSIVLNETKDIDYLIAQDRYINGGRLLIDNIGLNDKITFQVVDKDNVLGYGVGVVLDEFIKDYFIPTSGNLEVRLDYPAKIIAGLYLRLKYTCTHISGASIKCNLYLHWKAV
jgi:hypothetical protein